jgi:monothiol glutaredoxin
VGRPGRIPRRLVRETDLQEGSDRKVTTDLNQKTKRKTSMKTPKITAYLKTSCGWSEGVRSIMRKYNLVYEDRDIIKNPLFRAEMAEKSGQSLSPCVEINGHMLADVSGDEVEAYLLQAELAPLTAAVADAPTDRSCDAHHRE